MQLEIKRIYDPPSPEDGRRILVDRLWPRGMSKEKAQLDFWAREISPSNELRRWYAHVPERWPEFQARYAAELDANSDRVTELLEVLADGPGTLLFSSKELHLNNAEALRLYLLQVIEA